MATKKRSKQTIGLKDLESQRGKSVAEADTVKGGGWGRFFRWPALGTSKSWSTSGDADDRPTEE